MPAQAAGGLRVLRGLTVTVVAVMLAVLGHLAGGGDRPTWAALLLTVTLTAAVGTAASRRPSRSGPRTGRSPLWGLSAVLGTGQLIGHVAFSSVVAADAPVTGHVHGTLAALSTGAVVQTDRVLPTGVMVAAHVVATLAAAVLLAGGEAAFVAAADRLAARLPDQAPLRRPIAAPATVVAWLPVLPRTDHLGLSHGVRGPPVAPLT